MHLGLANATTWVLTLPAQNRVLALARFIQDLNVRGGLRATVFLALLSLHLCNI